MERALIAAGSVPVLERPEEVAPLVTELIAGERLVVLERRGGWLRVVAPGHATGLDPRGYPGWARPGGLVDASGREPDLAVVAPNPAMQTIGSSGRRSGAAWAGPALARESRGFALGLLLGQRLVSKMAVPSPPGALRPQDGRARRRGERRRDLPPAGPGLRAGRAGRRRRGTRGAARVGGAPSPLRIPRRHGWRVGVRAPRGPDV
jgi:hypothetical protein